MAVPVRAPQFDLQECRDEGARAFLERLHERAERGEWYADSWSHLRDHVVIAVTLTDRERRSVLRTLRADYVGPHLLLGDDETQQFATDLDPARQGVTRVPDGQPRELADVAADWLEREMQRPIVREEWLVPGQLRERWVLPDEGRVLCLRGTWNAAVRRSLGPPDRTAVVSGQASTLP